MNFDHVNESFFKLFKIIILYKYIRAIRRNEITEK